MIKVVRVFVGREVVCVKECVIHGKNDPVSIRPIERMTTRFNEFSISRIHCDKFQPSRTSRT